MSKNILILLIFFSIKSFTQKSTIIKLHDAKDYDALIVTEISENNTAEEIYYKAVAHYIKNDEENCIKYMNIAIKKDSTVPSMYYYKGISYYYKKQPEKSIKPLKKAIKLRNDQAYFYNSLGDSYNALNQLDSAYVNYKKGTLLPNATNENFSSLGSISFRLKKYNEAMHSFKKANELTKDKPEKQLFYLFNIGFIHQINKDFKSAETTFRKILEQYPNDYETISKLIQVLIAQNKYNLVEKYKQQLYKAYSDKKLPEGINDRFCFEHFEWNDNQVFAYENYAEPQDNEKVLFNKHQYYVYNKNEEYVCQVNSESSFVVRMHDGITYILALKNQNGFQSFWQFGFEKTDYKKMKKNVLSILNKEAKPDSSSTFKK